jgi:hypothetical protein
MPREKITRYQHVRDILDRAAGNGHPSHGGNGRFWNKPLQEFMQLRINTIPVIATPGANRGARSGLILGLKGEPPFGMTIRIFLECHFLNLRSRQLTSLSLKSGLMMIVPMSLWV